MSVGRDGASDAVSFLRVGVPAVEFGPVGDGHHGPEEWVSVSSLETYRQALESFLRSIPARLDDELSPDGRAGRQASRRPSGDHEPPPKPKRFWWRFSARLAVIIVAVSRRGDLDQHPASTSTASPTRSAHNNGLQSTTSHRYLAQVERRRAGDDPHPRLRQAGQPNAKTPAAPTRRSCCGSTPTRTRSRCCRSRATSRSKSPASGRQVQRRLHLRRAEADPAGGQGTDRPEDQPRRQRRLPRLRARGRRDRLRLRRRRPPLLPLERRRCRPPNSIRKSTSSPATSCSAARRRSSTCATATPTPTSSARPASRTSSASAREQVPIGNLVLDRNDLIDIFTEYTTSDINDKETMLEVAQAVHRLPQRARSRRSTSPPTSAPATSTRRRKRSRKRSTSSSAAKRAAVPRGRRRPGSKRRKERRRRARRGTGTSRRTNEAAAGDQAEAARRATASCRRTKPAKSRPRRSPARSAAASRSSTRPGFPRAPTTSKATPTNTSSGPARLPLHGHRRRTPRRLQDGRRAGQLSDGIHYFGVQGIQGWEDPPILDNPTLTEDDPRPRIRDLRRRRPAAAGRLAPRPEHLLGRQRPAQHPDQRPDARDRDVGEGDRCRSNPKRKRGGGGDE